MRLGRTSVIAAFVSGFLARSMTSALTIVDANRVEAKTTPSPAKSENARRAMIFMICSQ